MAGHALLEESFYDEKGRALNYTWRDYKQPTAMDVPECYVEHVHTHDPYGPFGAKGAEKPAPVQRWRPLPTGSTMRWG